MITRSYQADGTPSALDLFSTSQKSSNRICSYNAPFIAIIDGERGKIVQVCCNHWDCPKHGIVRAGQEYWRIVNGAKELAASHTLYFYTFTCRGKSLSLGDAERDYLLWTNRLLSTMRARCKREGGAWCYVQVTERQKRGHPHSHLLMAWIPSDARKKLDAKGKEYIYSKWFMDAHEKVGLGTQSKITEVANAEAASRYIAKYLFKDAMFSVMPKGWKRVRYSQSFPERVNETALHDDCYPLLGTADYKRANESGVWFECDNEGIYEYVHRRIMRVMRPSLIDKETGEMLE